MPSEVPILMQCADRLANSVVAARRDGGGSCHPAIQRQYHALGVQQAIHRGGCSKHWRQAESAASLSDSVVLQQSWIVSWIDSQYQSKEGSDSALRAVDQLFVHVYSSLDGHHVPRGGC